MNNQDNKERLNYFPYAPSTVPPPGEWTKLYKGICDSYPKLMRLPNKQEDCFDSSFTYTDDVSRVVKDEKRRFPSCVQMTVNTPYCYSLPDGSYTYNYPELWYNGV